MSLALSGVDKTSSPPTFDDVWGRVSAALNLQRQSDLAELLEVKSASVTDAKKRGVFPLSWAYTLSVKKNLSLDFIVRGQIVQVQPALNQAQPASPPPCAPELVMVPKVEARLSAGTGSLENGGEVRGLYAFRKDFLARKGQAGSMVLMDVVGDSMEPDLLDGDTVLIDQNQTAVRAGHIYAVSIGEEVMVKQVDRAPGKYVLRSKNRDYEPILIDLGDESSDFRIIGRIIWQCRER